MSEHTWATREVDARPVDIYDEEYCEVCGAIKPDPEWRPLPYACCGENFTWDCEETARLLAEHQHHAERLHERVPVCEELPVVARARPLPLAAAEQRGRLRGENSLDLDASKEDDIDMDEQAGPDDHVSPDEEAATRVLQAALERGDFAPTIQRLLGAHGVLTVVQGSEPDAGPNVSMQLDEALQIREQDEYANMVYGIFSELTRGIMLQLELLLGVEGEVNTIEFRGDKEKVS